MTTPVYEPPARAAEPGAPRARAFRSLAPEHVVVQRIGWWISAGVLTVVTAAGVAAGLLVGELSEPAWIGGTALGGALSVYAWIMARVWPPLEHARAGWALDASALHIRRGVWWRSVTSIPRARIQHTDVSQGPLQRGYDLATLVVYTAGTAHSKVELAGLRHAEATRVRDELLEGEGGHGA